MVKVIEVVVCGRQIGTKASPELYGTCDKEPGHPSSRGGHFGCSSKLLRESMRNAAAKSRAKTKKLKETPAPQEPIDDSADDEPICSCGRIECRYGDMVDRIPTTSPTILMERQQREVQEANRRAEEEANRRACEQFITECLDRAASSNVIDRQTEAKLAEACVRYLRIHDDIASKFRLDVESRKNRGFNSTGIGERHLSSELYGDEYSGFHAPDALDSASFKARLGRFLGVEDMRGCSTGLCTTHPISAVRTTVTTGAP